MSPRPSVLLVAALVGSALVGVPASAFADAHTAAGNPTSNVAPSSAFISACESIDNSSPADNDACDSAAAYAFSSVWASEGIGATFALPAGFDTMTVPDQLVAITNVERTARGLRPVAGRSAALDSIAQDGANNDDDPSLPTRPWRGDVEASNWAAAGNSVLLDDFYWMYDDGVDSPNTSCAVASDQECWAHRDNILFGYASPLMMGTAVAYGTTWGTSMTELFIGGDTADVTTKGTGSDSGTGAAGLALTTSAISITPRPLRAGRKTVTATVTSGSVPIAASITSGASSWQVSPKTCTATVRKPCVFTTTFSPKAPGTHNGRLGLHTSAGTQTVALHGQQSEPQLIMAVDGAGHHETVTATVVPPESNVGIAHARVVLQVWSGRHWHQRAAQRTNSHGVATFHPAPKHTRRFRLVVTGPGGVIEVASMAIVLAAV